jgi:hypothetical protein
MFDNFNHPSPARFDPIYPNTRRFTESVDRLGAEETLPSGVDAEVELIARSSYRLGHAESYAQSETRRAEELQTSLRDTKKLLEDAQRDARIYKERADTRYDESEKHRNEAIKWHDKFVKLDKKVNPSKYKVKKSKK